MPNRMPAFGLSAVPLPKKIRRIAPGYHAVAAEAVLALYMTVSETVKSVAFSSTGSVAGSALVVAAADLTVLEAPNSRRVAASAVHISGATAGPSPLPPVANQDNRFAPRAPIDAEAVARGAEDEAGVAATVETTEGEEEEAGGSFCTAVSSGFTDGVAGESPEGRSISTAGAGTPTGASLLRRGVVAAAGAEPLRGEEVVLSLDDGAAPRPDRRTGEVVLPEPEEAVDASELDPAEPVVSAKATGIDATAEPTPRATASAPTRPT